MQFLCAAAMVCVQLPEARSQTCGASIMFGKFTERHSTRVRLQHLAACCRCSADHDAVQRVTSGT